MLKKFLIGGPEGDYWVLSGDFPVGGSLTDGTAFSWPLSVNDSYIFMAGAGLPSTDGTIACFNVKGNLVWSAAVAEALVTGPPRVGQFSGFGSACDDNYVISVHEMEDDNYAIGTTGIVQCREVGDGTLVFQKKMTNSRCTHVCAENGYGYVGLSADADHNANYARINLVNGTVSGTGIKYSATGNPMRMACDTGSSVYFLTTDTSNTGNFCTDNTQLVKVSTTGTIQAQVKFDVSFANVSYINSYRADLKVLRSGGTDYIYTFTTNEAQDEINVVKFSAINGASSTVDWQKGITKSGWTVSGQLMSGAVDSNGNAYVISYWDDGGGNQENVLFCLDASTGAEVASVKILDGSSSFFTRGMEAQGDALVLVADRDLIRIPQSLDVSGTYSTYTFSTPSSYTVANSSITFSAGTISDVGDSYSFAAGTATDTDVTSSTSLTKTEMYDVV